MELSQLRYFCAVAETEHVTQTAERLHIAQPALTQSLHRLEKELGVELLAARGRGIALTECGRFLYKRLTPVLETLDRLPRELSAMAEREQNTVHLNVLAASTMVTAAVIEYRRQQHPTHFQLFQNGELDHCDLTIFTAMPGQPLRQDGGGFCCDERIYLAVPRQGRYAGRSAIRLEEAAQEEFAALGGGYRQFRAICDRFCVQAGFTPQVIFESDSPATVRNLIAAGLGVGFWPEFTWGVLDTPEVLLLPIASPDCRRQLVVRAGPGRLERPAVRQFYEFLAAYFQRFAETRPL